MDRYPSYEAFRAIHEARLQQVRASAVAAGLTERRRHRGPVRWASEIFAPRKARYLDLQMSESHSPETLFWA